MLKPSGGSFSSQDLSMQAKKDAQKSGATIPLKGCVLRFMMCFFACVDLLYMYTNNKIARHAF